MKAKNISWKEHPTQQQIYDDRPQVSAVLAQRRARFACDCMRASEQGISTVLHWRLQPANRGRRPLTFLDTVARDEGLELGDLRTAMLDHDVRRNIVNGIPIENCPK